MSNIPDQDACIIIGIDNSFNIVGVNVHLKQNNIQNTFSNLKFHGGIRPKFDVIPMELEGKQIDVVLIKHGFEGPIIPEVDYKKYSLPSNVVCTRFGEVNEEAKFNTMESLWWERFKDRTIQSTIIQAYIDAQNSLYELTTVSGKSFLIHDIPQLESFKDDLHEALNSFRMKCDSPLISSDTVVSKCLDTTIECVGHIEVAVLNYSQNMHMNYSTQSIDLNHKELMDQYNILKKYVSKKVTEYLK